MKLTPKQLHDLWGEGEPYSQVDLTKEERILGNELTRTFMYVQAFLNPFTYRFVKKHIKTFLNDPMVNHIVQHAEYQGQKKGFVSVVHGGEIADKRDRDNADKILLETRKAVIRMHQFVMDCISEKSIQ